MTFTSSDSASPPSRAQGESAPSPVSLGKLVGAIDQGTSSTRFLVFRADSAQLVTFHQVDLPTSTPRPGWVQQDPELILRQVLECISVVVDNLKQLEVDPADIVCVGITNQRETTIVWDKETGQPLYDAIVWMDTRTLDTEQALLQTLPRNENSKHCFQHLCGLPISSYFSALKVRWLLDNVPEVAKAEHEERLLFGTIDSWLMWNLTGGVQGDGAGTPAVHITDVTNASRTMLMNLETLSWDPRLLQFFGISKSILPEIRSSSEVYGRIAYEDNPLFGVTLSGCLGDQQAALLGQGCVLPGRAKNTYGTGCFLLCNVGASPVYSEGHGLLSTVAYQLGPKAAPAYALEGSIPVAGTAFNWMRDKFNMVSDVDEINSLASASGSDSGDVYFVPALSGLYVPRWRPDARGTICGLTQHSGREQLLRATMEAIAFQTREVLEAMYRDCGLELTSLLVDGGLSQSDVLLQVQADLLGLPLLRPSMAETTALGAAIAAGCAMDVWTPESVVEATTTDKFLPRLTEDERDVRFERWQEAVKRSLNWVETTRPRSLLMSDARYRLLSAVPAAIFSFTSLLLLKVADIAMGGGEDG